MNIKLLFYNFIGWWKWKTSKISPLKSLDPTDPEAKDPDTKAGQLYTCTKETLLILLFASHAFVFTFAAITGFVGGVFVGLNGRELVIHTGSPINTVEFLSAQWDLLARLWPSPVETVDSHLSWANVEEELKNELLKLKVKFPSQNRTTWLGLLSGISATFSEEEPMKPAAIVLLAHPDLDAAFALCFARKVAGITQQLLSRLTGRKNNVEDKLLEVSLENWDALQNTDDIHAQLDEYLSPSGMSGQVVILKDLQRFNYFPYLNILHAYTDNFEAPHKRAIFISTIPVPGSVERYNLQVSEILQGNKLPTELAYKVLDTAWTVLSEEKRMATIARVADTVVFLKPGDFCNN